MYVLSTATPRWVNSWLAQFTYGWLNCLLFAIPHLRLDINADRARLANNRLDERLERGSRKPRFLWAHQLCARQREGRNSYRLLDLGNLKDVLQADASNYLGAGQRTTLELVALLLDTGGRQQHPRRGGRAQLKVERAVGAHGDARGDRRADGDVRGAGVELLERAHVNETGRGRAGPRRTLQKSIDLTPLEPSAGPTGGDGLAWPAPTISLTIWFVAMAFLDIAMAGGIWRAVGGERVAETLVLRLCRSRAGGG